MEDISSQSSHLLSLNWWMESSSWKICPGWDIELLSLVVTFSMLVLVADCLSCIIEITSPSPLYLNRKYPLKRNAFLILTENVE